METKSTNIRNPIPADQPLHTEIGQSASPYAENILISLRRIIRAIDLHSRELGARFRLTVPQLVCLRQLRNNGPVTASQLAREVYLSQATVTGIINRLEDRGLVRRERKHADRRLVTVSLTDDGRTMVDSAPLPLQDRFSARLSALDPVEQDHISGTLARVVEMMEAQELEAIPIMTPEPLHQEGEAEPGREALKQTTGP